MSQQEINAKSFKKFKGLLDNLYLETEDVAKKVVTKQANTGLRVTKKNTPVGVYKYKQGGTLRKGWKRNPTVKIDNEYMASYFNNIEYGLYVNNGHRVVNKSGKTVGSVQGVRMLEQGINEAKRQTRRIFNEEIDNAKKKGGW